MGKSSAAKGRSPYDVHPGVAMVQKWLAGLKPKTGRTLEEWVALVKKEGPTGHLARRNWLKSMHKVNNNEAWGIVDRAEGKGGDEDTPEAYLEAAERYVEAQYSGQRSALRPIYEELLELGGSLGGDVRACPCRTMVPLYRKHVFAQIKPATYSRVELGLCFTTYKGKLPKRLVNTGGLAKKDRITHRIEVTGLRQIDAELKKWLLAAYELDA
jgi:Domain of unknown function (DUF5655)/Domain of unknown function (DUF4287)